MSYISLLKSRLVLQSLSKEIFDRTEYTQLDDLLWNKFLVIWSDLAVLIIKDDERTLIK